MAMLIQLVSEENEKLKEVVDSQGYIYHLLSKDRSESRYNLLRYIDPYGDTIFNRIQMDDFLDQWKTLSKKAKDEQEKMVLIKVEELAKECRDEVHLYLKFIGD